MQRLLWLLVLTPLVLVACSTSVDSPSAQLAAHYGLHLTGRGTANSITIPDNLASATWDQIQYASRKAGFDLRPYRGQKLTVKSYPLKERFNGGPTTLNVIEHEGTVVGAYVIVEDEAGGTYSLPYVSGSS